MLPKDFFGNQWKTLPVSTLPKSSYSIRSLLWTHQTYNKLAKGSALTKESYARWTTCRPGSNSVVLAWPQMHLLLNLFSIWYIWWPQDTRAWSLEWSSSKVFRQLAIKMHKKCSRKPSASCSYVCYWKYCGFLVSGTWCPYPCVLQENAGQGARWPGIRLNSTTGPWELVRQQDDKQVVGCVSREWQQWDSSEKTEKTVCAAI